MKFKKIMSVIASAVMISSTIIFAAAAAYPTPFTSGTAIVYGTNGANSDMAGAIDIYDQLKARATGTTRFRIFMRWTMRWNVLCSSLLLRNTSLTDTCVSEPSAFLPVLVPESNKPLNH